MYDTQLVEMLAAAMVTISVVVVVLYVITVIAYWQIFKKAGEKGWKSLIPVYNSYIMYKISWKTSMFWIEIALGVLYSILYGISYSSGSAVLSVLAYIVYIAVIVIGIMVLHKLSKAFGHGVGFTVGLVLLSPIFILILAFGSSQYVGNTTVEAKEIEE